MNLIKSDFLFLDRNDFLKGLIVAILAAVLTALANLFNAPGFSFGGVDWSQVGQIAIMAGIAYLSKNVLTTKSGSFMGITSNS